MVINKHLSRHHQHQILWVSCLRIQRGCECEKVSRYTTRKRALKSHRLSETPIVWRNTSDTFTPRGLGYNRASCELVKCFELKESDGELHRSCLRRQPTCLQSCARLVIGFGSFLMQMGPKNDIAWEFLHIEKLHAFTQLNLRVKGRSKKLA